MQLSDTYNDRDMRSRPVFQAGQVSSSSSVRHLRGVLIGVGIAAGLVAGHYFLMKQAGHALASHWDELGDYPRPGGALAKIQNPGEALKIAERICRGRSASTLLPRELKFQLDMAPNVALGEELLLQHAAYIGCLTRERPERFCGKGQDRAHLVASVNDYFKLQKSVREERIFGSANRLALSYQFSGGPRAATSYPSELTDPSMAASLVGVVQRGYVGKWEFGRYFGLIMPGNLGEVLRDATRQGRGCA